MNKARRKTLSEAMDLLYRAKDIIETVRDEESESLENIPDNLRETDRYYDMEEKYEKVEEAYDSLEELLENLEEVIE